MAIKSKCVTCGKEISIPKYAITTNLCRKCEVDFWNDKTKKILG